ALRLVDAERLQPRVEIGRQRGGAAVLVVEGEHPDAAGLAVAAQGKTRRLASLGGLAQDAGDRLQLRGRPVAEKGHGEVQVLPRYDPDTVDTREGLVLPEHDRFEGRRGQEESQ